jgi:hypothetical protein
MSCLFCPHSSKSSCQHSALKNQHSDWQHSTRIQNRYRYT